MVGPRVCKHLIHSLLQSDQVGAAGGEGVPEQLGMGASLRVVAAPKIVFLFIDFDIFIYYS